VRKAPIKFERDFQKLFRESGHEAGEAKRRPEPLLKKKTVTLAEILSRAWGDLAESPALPDSVSGKSVGDDVCLLLGVADAPVQILPPVSRSHDSTRRIMSELRKLQQHPHPSVDIYPCEENIGFWKVILEGPDSTPYKNGTWLLWVKFPADFPQTPPEIRFETPIFHCNINSHGKICHSIFDRNWSAETTMSTVLECIYGLLLSPDTSDPLDSTHALAFYDDSGGYEAGVIQHTMTHAGSVSRVEWRHAVQAMCLDAPACVEQCRVCLNEIGAILVGEGATGVDAIFTSINRFDFSNASSIVATHQEILLTSCKSRCFMPALLARV